MCAVVTGVKLGCKGHQAPARQGDAGAPVPTTTMHYTSAGVCTTAMHYTSEVECNVHFKPCSEQGANHDSLTAITGEP